MASEEPFAFVLDIAARSDHTIGWFYGAQQFTIFTKTHRGQALDTVAKFTDKH